MKFSRLFLPLFLIFLAFGPAVGQRTSQTFRRCAGQAPATASARVEIQKRGSIALVPCSGGSVILGDAGVSAFSPIFYTNRASSVPASGILRNLESVWDLTFLPGSFNARHNVSRTNVVSNNVTFGYVIGSDVTVDLNGAANANYIMGGVTRASFNGTGVLNTVTGHKTATYSAGDGQTIHSINGVETANDWAGGGTINGHRAHVFLKQSTMGTPAFASGWYYDGDFAMLSRVPRQSRWAGGLEVDLEQPYADYELGNAANKVGLTVWLKSTAAANAITVNKGRAADMFTVDSGGNTNLLTGQLRVATQRTPASSAEACTQGTVNFDTNYIYFCTATGVWKRSAILTW